MTSPLIEAVSDAEAEAAVAVAAYLMGADPDADEAAVALAANDVWAARFLDFLKKSGYVVVPVEPTEAMQFAGGEYTSGSAFVYKAMLAAHAEEQRTPSITIVDEAVGITEAQYRAMHSALPDTGGE